MRRKLRSQLTYANVISTLALFLVLSGGAAYAANTVFSSDIVDNEVYSADVRNDGLTGGGLAAIDLRAGAVGTSEVLNDSATGGGLTASDLRAGSVGSSEVVDNSLGAADVNEAALAKVPAATNADKLGGVAARPVRHLVGAGATDHDRCQEPATGVFCSQMFGSLVVPWENLGGSWQPAAFYKDAFGIVHLEGVIRETGCCGSGVFNRIFILPAGYRPAAAHIFIVTGREFGDPREANGRIDVGPSGEVLLAIRPDSNPASTGNLVHLSLDGISFLAG